MVLAGLSFLMSGMDIKLHVSRIICEVIAQYLPIGVLQLYVHLPTGRPYCHGDVNIAWQFPQLVLISFAEIIVTVTGLELAYSQAPPDLRSEKYG